jgi:hypothetical protein
VRGNAWRVGAFPKTKEARAPRSDFSPARFAAASESAARYAARSAAPARARSAAAQFGPVRGGFGGVEVFLPQFGQGPQRRAQSLERGDRGRAVGDRRAVADGLVERGGQRLDFAAESVDLGLAGRGERFGGGKPPGELFAERRTDLA